VQKLIENAYTKKTSFGLLCVTIIPVVKSSPITLHIKSFAWISIHPWWRLCALLSRSIIYCCSTHSKGRLRGRFRPVRWLLLVVKNLNSASITALAKMATAQLSKLCSFGERGRVVRGDIVRGRPRGASVRGAFVRGGG